ncbi:MAG: LysR family transcriptional regulator [Burkholderiales bacterium]|nr:LysR family transcriptional regulator [Burkholderiales bacterium]MDE2276208.1 LysR family transcriptional regulator [Burkholderiales bacterium]
MNFRTLDLNLLRVLDAVMAEGSLTRAAAALSMTQPAVSHALRRLRQALGQELFVRTAHGMRATPQAEQLWPQVRQALAGLRQALAPDDFDPRRDAVQLRLAMADATAALLAPGLVRGIEASRAQVNLRLVPLTTRDPRLLLEGDDVDLAVGFFPEAVTAILAQGDDSLLRHARLYETRYVCVMRKGHPLAGPPLTLDAYCAAGHLLVSFSGRPHGYTDQALAALGRQRRIVLTVNQFFTAGRVVTQSDLLTVLPESFVRATGYADALAIRELPLALGPVSVEMLWHLRHDAAPAHRWLRQQVQAAAGG